MRILYLTHPWKILSGLFQDIIDEGGFTGIGTLDSTGGVSSLVSLSWGASLLFNYIIFSLQNWQCCTSLHHVRLPPYCCFRACAA